MPTKSTTPGQLPVRLTPPQLAEMLNVSPGKIIGWIASGELPAVNVAANRNGQRPRWRISLDALEAFEKARSTGAIAPKAPRRRTPKPADVTGYF